MIPKHNIPCITLTPRILESMCHYKWSLPIVEDNINNLTPNAWRILRLQPWAVYLFEKYSNYVPENL